jgi:hypothetical protein
MDKVPTVTAEVTVITRVYVQQSWSQESQSHTKNEKVVDDKSATKSEVNAGPTGTGEN